MKPEYIVPDLETGLIIKEMPEKWSLSTG